MNEGKGPRRSRRTALARTAGRGARRGDRPPGPGWVRRVYIPVYGATCAAGPRAPCWSSTRWRCLLLDHLLRNLGRAVCTRPRRSGRYARSCRSCTMRVPAALSPALPPPSSWPGTETAEHASTRPGARWAVAAMADRPATAGPGPEVRPRGLAGVPLRTRREDPGHAARVQRRHYGPVRRSGRGGRGTRAATWRLPAGRPGPGRGGR